MDSGKQNMTIEMTLALDQELKDKLKMISGYIQSMANRTGLTAETGHEVKNLLSILYGHSDLMKHYLDEQNLEGLKKSLDRMEGGIRQLNTFTNQLLGKPSEKHLEEIRLIPFLNSVISFIKPQPLYSLIKFHRHWKNQDLTVRADEFQLQQIFVNIFKNAAEATKRGVITVSLDDVAGEDRVQIRVSDNGPGMLPEFAGRIFNHPISTKKNGNGLGLLIVHKLVEENGGTIEVASRISRGTDFILTFPVYKKSNPQGDRP